MAKISASGLKAAMDRPDRLLVLDVRQGFREGDRQIPGALRVEASRLSPALCRLPADTLVVVYDAGPELDVSAMVVEALVQAGYGAEVLEGGWEAWVDGGLPTEELPGAVLGRLEQEEDESEIVWQDELPLGRDVRLAHEDLPSGDALAKRAIDLVAALVCH